MTENLRVAPSYDLLSPIKHCVVLASCAGDTPAQVKLRNAKGHSGYLSCSHCSIVGSYEESAVRFLGYSEPAQHGE